MIKNPADAIDVVALGFCGAFEAGVWEAWDCDGWEAWEIGVWDCEAVCVESVEVGVAGVVATSLPEEENFWEKLASHEGRREMVWVACVSATWGGDIVAFPGAGFNAVSRVMEPFRGRSRSGRSVDVLVVCGVEWEEGVDESDIAVVSWVRRNSCNAKWS